MSAALDPLPVACFALQEQPPGADLLCTALNSRACQLLGLAPDQPAPDGLAVLEALVAPAERAGFRRSWQQARAAGEPFHWEGPLTEQAPHQWLRVLLEPGAQGRWHGVLIDLSRLKQELLTTRRILDNVPIAIAISGLDGDDPPITLLNAEFQRCYGWGEGELQRLSDWAERAYPDPSYRQTVIRQWLAAVERARRQEGAVAGMEFQVHTATGERRDVLFSGRVIGQELLVTLLDVSERRQAQAELLQARDALARTALEVTEAIPVGTYTMVLRPGSPLASFSFMSERFLELTGLERQEALDDPLKAFACVHPDDYDAWVQLNAEVFARKLPFFGQTRVVVNGEVRWITAESVPRDLPDGTTVWEGVLIDVTERIEAQQQLQSSQEQLERILDNIPVAIAINNLDPDDPEITFLNAHFIRTLGYSRAHIPRLSDWARLAYPDASYRQEVFRNWSDAIIRAQEHEGTVAQAEYRVRSSDGRTLQMLISAVVLEDMVLVALIDVTRSRQAERRLLEALERERAQEEQLRRGIEEKLRVSLSASAVAHEISQPLSAILINSQLALRALEAGEAPEPAALRALLEPLLGEAQRMDLITERIRMLLRQVETQRLPLDLRELVESALLQLAAPLAEAGISLETRGSGAPVGVSGDPVQLQLSLINLLRNGLEALRDAGTPEPRIQLTLQHACNGVELVVADNGPGFPPGFDPQLPLNSTKTGGSGIGLYVVRLTMENHGGSISIGRSAVLGGAEVTLRLPASQGR